MYSSVKFFEPTVSVTLPLSGFDWISPAWALVVDELLPPPPQAARPTVRIEAASRQNSARNRVFVLIKSLLRFWDTIPAPAGCPQSYAGSRTRCKVSPRGVKSDCRPA